MKSNKYRTVFTFFLISLVLLCFENMNSMTSDKKIYSWDHVHKMWTQEWFGPAEIGNILMIIKLMHSVNVNTQNQDGNTALMLAAGNGHENIVQELLQISDIDINLQNKHGNNALIIAVSRGYENIVKLLLGDKTKQKSKVNINAQNKKGATALIVAAYLGQENIAELLLDWPDININSIDDAGWTALFHAAQQGREAVTKLLLQNSQIDINTQDVRGNTPLMIASYWGNINIVNILLAAPGISINVKDCRGRTAYIIAQDRKQRIIAEIIKQKTEALTSQAFGILLSMGQPETNKNLILLKSIVEQIGDDVVDADNNTLLDKAFLTNQPEIIFLLLNLSKDPRKQLTRFPFEFVSPSSSLFKYFFDLAFCESTTINSSKDKDDLDRTCKPKLCASCGKVTTKFCVGCRKIYYCSDKCQKADWKNHKLICKQ